MFREMETWKLLAWLCGLLVVFWLSVELLSVPPTVMGFITMVVFIGVGMGIGRLITKKLN